MQKPEDTTELLSLLDDSPELFHAVKKLRQRLLAEGFREVREEDHLQTPPEVNEIIIRGNTSITAWIPVTESPSESCFSQIDALRIVRILTSKPMPTSGSTDIVN